MRRALWTGAIVIGLVGSAAAQLPETPSRGDVMAVMQALQPQLASCANGAHGTVRFHFLVASDGRVRQATLEGSLGAGPIGESTPEGRCMRSLAERAVFPAFTRPTFEVTYPFRF